MCVVSMIGDYGSQILPKKYPWILDYPKEEGKTKILRHPSQDEFDALKKEVEELKKLLLAAKRIDELTGQPDCEIEDKYAKLKKIAEIVGIDMDDVFIGRMKKNDPLGQKV